MADFDSKYTGEQVEALLDQVASGNAGGGGGGITAETDPVFSASPAASITEQKIAEWDKGATAVQPETLSEYALEGYVDNEVKALGDSLAKVATSGSYNDLVDKPTFKTINGESILGSGDIEISGGSGEVGPQGPQGDKGDKGDTGVGVQSVKQTTISNTDGGSNVVTVTLTNGTTSTFTVKNGSKGSSGSNGTNGKDGADGADGATFTPSVDSAGNLSWTNNKGLTNPPTVNIKGPKGDAGSGGGSGGPTIVEVYGLNQSIGLEDNTIYKAGSVAELEVYPLEQLNIGSVVRFRAIGDCTITISDVYWANGVTPTIEAGVAYELSLASDENGELLAVLTPFKPA